VCFKIVPLLDLLEYIGSLGGPPAALERMFADFDGTAGRNFARLLLDPETNQGLDTAMERALPRLCNRPGFWAALFDFLGSHPRSGLDQELAARFRPALAALRDQGLLEDAAERELAGHFQPGAWAP
jgi:hypothetical protein